MPVISMVYDVLAGKDHRWPRWRPQIEYAAMATPGGLL